MEFQIQRTESLAAASRSATGAATGKVEELTQCQAIPAAVL